MQKWSARAAVTRSGSRSDERRMHAQRGGRAFRSGQQNHFAILCLVPDFCAPRPPMFAAGFLQAAPHSAAPPCIRIPSIRLYRSASLPVGANHGGALIFRRKRQTKNPRRGEQPRGGVLWVRGGRRVTIHRADLRYAFIKRRWLSVRFATLEPGNRFDYAHVRPCRVPRRRGRRVSLEQHLLRRGARNEQPTWMTAPPAPPPRPPGAGRRAP